jgi:hypothetical protein
MVPTELVPTSLRLKPDADGRDFVCLFSAGRELRKSSFQVLVTSRAPGYPEERSACRAARVRKVEAIISRGFGVAGSFSKCAFASIVW